MIKRLNGHKLLKLIMNARAWPCLIKPVRSPKKAYTQQATQAQPCGKNSPVPCLALPEKNDSFPQKRAFGKTDAGATGSIVFQR
jgi:hypothetical protein